MNKLLIEARRKVGRQLAQPRPEPNLSILLHPNIPKPLHTVNPRSIKGQKWWDEVRQKAYKELDYHCHACGVPKWNAKINQWLEAHEMYDIDYAKGEVTLAKIVALCTPCHLYIHSGLAEVLLGKGELDQETFDMIRERGNKLLKEAKLKSPKIPEKTAEWGEWHLVFEGKTYPTPFESFMNWQNHWAEEDRFDPMYFRGNVI